MCPSLLLPHPGLFLPKQFHACLLSIVLQASQQSYKFWNQFRNRMEYTSLPTQDTIDDMETGPLKFSRFKRLAIILASSRISCKSCQAGRALERTPPGPDLNRSTVLEMDTSGADGEEEDTSTALVAGVNRSKEAVKPITLPENSGTDIVAPSSIPLDNFDDYSTAKATINEPHIIPETWTFNSQGSLILDKHWSIWRDRGYRLETCFFSMFDFEGPILHLEHLLPCHEPGIQS